MPGVNTLFEALQRNSDTGQVTVTTEELAGGQEHDFILDASDDKVNSVDFKPSDEEPISEGLILLIRPIVTSGSTDTSLAIYEDEARDDIDEVVRVNNLSVNDAVQSFQPGGGAGVQFQNQADENELYITIDEKSNTASEYTIRLRWFSVR